MEKSAKQDAESSKVIKVRVRKSKPELISPALYSQKDVRRIVTEFVSAWINGDIIIRFPTAAELSKKNPLAITFPTDPSVSEELKIKEHYVDLLMIVAGVKQVASDELDEAVNEVFKMMLMFRSANRIEGKIMSNDLEKRVVTLEEKIQSTSKLVDQITNFIFKELKKPT